MPLTPGTRLGPYEIAAPLGAGGMGEVYKARDTRLDRTVAIKILPAALADDPQFKERFDREARAISQLDHPNICALYDTGEASPEPRDASPVRYLVMQFLEGETLADRIAKGPLPLDQALAIAVQIADALVAAHRAGIVHRDLKPGNVMLTKTGAKLLDFGLAKSGASMIAGAGATMLPTTPAALTVQGQILGTFQYMAPEQLEGLEADARSDIFAFGSLLHELVTGKKAFEGKSHASLVAAILERQPPTVSSLQPLAPPDLDRIVAKCLAKDPDDRWQSAKDLKDALKWVSGSASQLTTVGSGVGAAPAVRRRRSWMPWSAAGVLAIALVASVWLGRSGYFIPPAEPPPAARVVVPLPEHMLLADLGTAESFALSPDGKYLVFAAVGAATGRTRTLWVRPLDATDARELPGTDNAAAPFWSPDSKSVAFMAQGKLKRIDIAAGRPSVLTDASTSMKGAWGADDTIVFLPRVGPLYRVSASGGQVSRVEGLHTYDADTIMGGPSFLPDGRHFLYYAEKQSGSDASLWVGSLDRAQAKRIAPINSSAVFAEGHLFFLRDQTLMTQRFDAVKLELAGEAQPLADQVDVVTRPLRGAFTVSRNGALAYRVGTSIVRTQLTWFDRNGKALSAVGDVADQLGVELSPDGTRALVSLLDTAHNSRDLWIYDLARGLRTRFTFDPADEMLGVWTPDGSQIIFNSRRVARLDLYMKPSSGAGAETPLMADNQNNLYPTGITPDGKSLIYFNGNASSKTGNDIWTVPLTGERKPVPVVQTEFNETYPQLSDDGRWLAYVSAESGHAEVYVTPYPGPGGKWQISTAGGSTPRWRHDGKELFFVSADRKLMSALVAAQGSTFSVGAVQPLFDTTIRQIGFAGANAFNFDVLPDGQRFLILSTQDNAAATPITLVVNWAGLLKP